MAGRIKKEPTRLGRYVLDRMHELGMERQVHLVEASGLSPATVSRIIFEPGFNPDHSTVYKLACGLQVVHEDLLLFVHNLAADAVPKEAPADPLVIDVSRLLGPESPLDDKDRTELRHSISRDLTRYQRKRD